MVGGLLEEERAACTRVLPGGSRDRGARPAVVREVAKRRRRLSDLAQHSRMSAFSFGLLHEMLSNIQLFLYVEFGKRAKYLIPLGMTISALVAQ